MLATPAQRIPVPALLLPSLAVFSLSSVLVLTVLFLTRAALRLQVDYFDSYHIFLNARAIASHTGQIFDIFRPTGISLLYTPLLALEKSRLSSLVPFPACHLFAVTLFTLLLFALYRLYRLHLEILPALLAVSFFALNPLVIHLAPFSKEDIPATLFTVAALFFFLRWKKTRRKPDFIAVVGFCSMAVITRYNLLPVLPPFLAFFTFTDDNNRVWRSRLLRAIGVGIMPLVVFFLLSCALYLLMGRASISEVPRKFISDLLEQYRFNHLMGFKPAIVAYFLLVRLVPPAVRLIAILGIAGILIKPRREDMFWGVWFFAFFLFHAHFVPGKETRYLLPLLPAVAYLAVRGLMIFHSWMDSALASTTSRLWYFTVIFVLFGALPARSALREVLRFEDPVYTTPFAEEVSREAEKLADGNRIFWVGPFYPLHPKEFVYHPWDDFAYLYHFSADSLMFFARHAVFTIDAAEVVKYARPGDVLVVNEEPQGYTTRSVPSQLKPLVVEKISRIGLPNGRAEIAYQSVRRFAAP